MIWYIAVLILFSIPAPNKPHCSNQQIITTSFNFSTATHQFKFIAVRNTIQETFVYLLSYIINDIVYRYRSIGIVQHIQNTFGKYGYTLPFDNDSYCAKPNRSNRRCINQFCFHLIQNEQFILEYNNDEDNVAESSHTDRCKQHDCRSHYDNYKANENSQTITNDQNEFMFNSEREIAELDFNKFKIDQFQEWKQLQLARYFKDHHSIQHDKKSTTVGDNIDHENTENLSGCTSNVKPFERTKPFSRSSSEQNKISLTDNKKLPNSEKVNSSPTNIHNQKMNCNIADISHSGTDHGNRYCGNGERQRTPLHSFKKSTSRHRNNYANANCGAKIVAANHQSQNAKEVLSENRDGYMLNPCKVSIWFIIELCERIHIESVELASFELFARVPKKFRLSGATEEEFDPSIINSESDNLNSGGDREQSFENWYDLGTFTFSSFNRKIHQFNVSMVRKNSKIESVIDKPETGSTLDDNLSNDFNNDFEHATTTTANQMNNCEGNQQAASKITEAKVSVEFNSDHHSSNADLNFYKSIHHDIYEHPFVKYVRFEMLEYEGTEHYCPLSLVRIYGSTLEEVINSHEQQNENTLINAFESSIHQTLDCRDSLDTNNDNKTLSNQSRVDEIKTIVDTNTTTSSVANNECSGTNNMSTKKYLPIGYFLITITDKSSKLCSTSFLSTGFYNDNGLNNATHSSNIHADKQGQPNSQCSINYLGTLCGLQSLQLWTITRDSKTISKEDDSDMRIKVMSLRSLNCTKKDNLESSKHIVDQEDRPDNYYDSGRSTSSLSSEWPRDNHLQSNNTNRSFERKNCGETENKSKVANGERSIGQLFNNTNSSNTNNSKFTADNTIVQNDTCSTMDSTDRFTNDKNANDLTKKHDHIGDNSKSTARLHSHQQHKRVCDINSSIRPSVKFGTYINSGTSSSNQPLLVRYGNRLNMLELNTSLQANYLDLISFDYNVHMHKIVSMLQATIMNLRKRNIENTRLLESVKRHSDRFSRLERRIMQIELKLDRQQSERCKSLVVIYIIMLLSFVIAVLVSISFSLILFRTYTITSTATFPVTITTTNTADAATTTSSCSNYNTVASIRNCKFERENILTWMSFINNYKVLLKYINASSSDDLTSLIKKIHKSFFKFNSTSRRSDNGDDNTSHNRHNNHRHSRYQLRRRRKLRDSELKSSKRGSHQLSHNDNDNNIFYMASTDTSADFVDYPVWSKDNSTSIQQFQININASLNDKPLCMSVNDPSIKEENQEQHMVDSQNNVVESSISMALPTRRFKNNVSGKRLNRRSRELVNWSSQPSPYSMSSSIATQFRRSTFRCSSTKRHRRNNLSSTDQYCERQRSSTPRKYYQHRNNNSDYCNLRSHREHHCDDDNSEDQFCNSSILLLA
ncbi:hypothetical protein GJ496_001447 [Pomphorhynchus laevis]|nr:hypothetical protein GJ496_001447 [Pomphorhynchus laevis]